MEDQVKKIDRSVTSHAYIEIRDLRRFALKGNKISVFDNEVLKAEYEFQLEFEAGGAYQKINYVMACGGKSLIIKLTTEIPDLEIEEFHIT
ncbi:MAG TPA: hypothetical protein PLK90_02745 [Clostridiales bacterium]|nr:hypothetical protein [Clostridiales bacterium]HQP69296.1 hypothetical protein [Clostridiales bacterium]